MRINNAKTNLLSILVTVLLFQTHSLCGMERLKKFFSKSKVRQTVESDSQSDDEEGISEDSCLICHGMPKPWPHKINLCRGKHKYCTECIAGWIQTCQQVRQPVTCPGCRVEIAAGKQKDIQTFHNFVLENECDPKILPLIDIMQKEFDQDNAQLVTAFNEQKRKWDLAERQVRTITAELDSTKKQLGVQQAKYLKLERELVMSRTNVQVLGVTLACVGSYAAYKFFNNYR